MNPLSDIQKQKEILRRQAYDARNGEKDQAATSQKAIEILITLPEYQNAGTVLWYVDARNELMTQAAVSDQLNSGKEIVVPYCTKGEQGENKLGLWRLESMDELVVGKWKILEPPREEWDRPDKQISEQELDLVIVPGVAFGRDGARLGNGQGYYDRLLSKISNSCVLLGLCYESQLLGNITMESHDIYVDRVVTQSRVYEGRGRATSDYDPD